MTLRMDQVLRQLPALLAAYREQYDAVDFAAARAAAALGEWARNPEGAEDRIRAAMAGRSEPYAVSLVEPVNTSIAATEPPPRVVVATDGSSIEPDRFAPVQCFVVNTGHVVLPYGVEEPADLGATAVLGPSDPGGANRKRSRPLLTGINLRRDVAELERAAELGAGMAARHTTVVLVDGTIFPWELDSTQIPSDLRGELALRTGEALERLAEAPGMLTFGAYISHSAASGVVTSLAALDPAAASWPFSDGMLFLRLLDEGERSAVFKAESERRDQVESGFDPRHATCFFYMRTGDDIARVELPFWVAESPERIALLHGALVDQCARCAGYPRALQEAHEQAVISGPDREQFERLLGVEAGRAGYRAAIGGKSASKRRRAL